MLSQNPMLALILSCLTALEKETYVIGGAVRNHLLGLEFSDIDITTRMKPEQIVSFFKEIPLDTKGLKFGNVKVQLNDEWVSITTFRKDVYDYKSRYPKQIHFVDSLEEDISRRDFVINTICYHQTKGFVDLLDGRKDLDRLLIRTVKKAEESFQEDPLRMVRALRFCCEYDFDLSADIVEAIRKYYQLIGKLSLTVTSQEKKLMKNGRYFLKKKRQYPSLFRILYL